MITEIFTIINTEITQLNIISQSHINKEKNQGSEKPFAYIELSM